MDASNVQATVTVDTTEGFYFGRFGYERKCVIATSHVHLGESSTPLATFARDLNGDDLDPERAFALAD